MSARGWAPPVPGIVEVFRARFTDHVYPPHTHDTWTLLVVDEGAIRYDLDRSEHGAVRSAVTVLPPDVAHTGRAGTERGFCKRVLYLDTGVLPNSLTGAAIASPGLVDPVLRRRVHELHAALGDPLQAESRLALVADRIREHLGGVRPDPGPTATAARFRDLLDARVADAPSLREAGRLLEVHPAHLVRSFTRSFGLPPHRWLTGRRIELARRRLLAGEPIAEVALAVGFHDQAHLHRHFSRLVGTTPGRFATR